MASKNKRKHSSVRTTIAVILFAAVILAAMIAAVLLLTKDTQKQGQPESAETVSTPEISTQTVFSPAEPMDFEVPGFTQIMDALVGQVDRSLRICYVGAFTGNFMEDGSDEPVENVLALIVENNGGDWVEDAEITLPVDGMTARFHLSGMINGSMALLLEQSRMTYSAGMRFGEPACGAVAKPVDKVFDFSEDFALYVVDGFINVENISDRTFENGVRVYYKNQQAGILWGGICYNVSFAGPIAPGEIRQMQAMHFTEANSQIVYLSYAE